MRRTFVGIGDALDDAGGVGAASADAVVPDLLHEVCDVEAPIRVHLGLDRSK